MQRTYTIVPRLENITERYEKRQRRKEKQGQVCVCKNELSVYGFTNCFRT